MIYVLLPWQLEEPNRAAPGLSHDGCPGARTGRRSQLAPDMREWPWYGGVAFAMLPTVGIYRALGLGGVGAHPVGVCTRNESGLGVCHCSMPARTAARLEATV